MNNDEMVHIKTFEMQPKLSILEKKRDCPGRIVQLVAGSILGQGTYKNQPVNV